MAKTGNTTCNAGRRLRFPYLCCLLRKRYLVTILAVTSITWTDVGLWRFSRSSSHAGRAAATTVARSGLDSSYLSYTPSVKKLVREKTGLASRFSHAPSAFFDKLSDLFTYSSPVFVAASAQGTDVHPPADRSPASALPSVERSYLSQVSAPLRLLQAVSNFFMSQGDSRDLAKKATKDSSIEAHQTHCTGAVSTSEGCSLTRSGSFYGRMLQAVSDLIPGRLYSEAGEQDAEEDGFLSRRRPRRGLWLAPGIVELKKTTETEADEAVQEVEKSSTTHQADAEEQVSTAEAAVDGGLNIFSAIADYSLGGGRDLGKKRPRRTPLWSLSAFPTPIDSLFHTSNADEVRASSNTTSEEEEEEQQQQHRPQVPAASPAGENESKQPQQQLARESVETPDLYQMTAEPVTPARPTSPAKERTERQQVDVPFKEEAGAVIETRQPTEKLHLSPSEDDLERTRNPLHDDVAGESSNNKKDTTKRIGSSGGNSSNRSKDRTTKGNRDSSRSTDRTNSSSSRNSSSSSRSNSSRSSSSRQNVKDSSSSRDSKGSSSSGSGGSKPHRSVDAANKHSEFLERGKRADESGHLTLQEELAPDGDELFLYDAVSPAQFERNGGFVPSNAHSVSGGSKRTPGSSERETDSGRTSIRHHRSATKGTDTITRNTRRSDSTSSRGPASSRPSRSVSSSTPIQNTSSGISQLSSNREKSNHQPTTVFNKVSERGGNIASSAPVSGSDSLFGSLLSTPIQLLFKSGAGDTSVQLSHVGSTQNKSRSSGRSSRSRRSRKSKPAVTLDTLREGGGLGNSFAHAVDASGAVIDVLSASKDLQAAIEALDLSAFGLPAVKSSGNSNGKSNGFEKLHSAAKAVEEVANWSAAMDHAINTGKHLGESVSSSLRTLHHTTPSLSSFFEASPAAWQDTEQANANILKGNLWTKDRAREGGLAAANAEQEDSEADMKQQISIGDWRSAAMAALKAATHKAEGLQKVLQAALDKSDNPSTSSSNKVRNDPLLQHASNVNNILIAIAGLAASERARSSQKQEREKQHQDDDKDEQPQQHLGTGAGSLLSRAASVRDKVGALFQLNAHPEGPSEREYMMPLLRELYRAARHVFEVLDVSISVADESMDAMQLGKLLRMYETLVEEGKLAAVGFRSPRVPKRLGQPKVSCANKGMTCCVPAATAGPDWKQKQQQQLFLQNSPQQECRAVFVSRSSMLCASTPYRNSPCNITHTKTAAMDKYSALLPVPAFSAAALCECEISRQRNSDGLQRLDGKAEWTAGEIPADLIEKARKGWQYVKGLSTSGNTLVHLLDNTLGSPELNFPYGGAPVRDQASRRQQKRQEEQQQQQEEELAEKPFSGLADAVTKVLVNQQLLKLFKSEDPAAAVIPPISVSMHLPKKTKSLLLSGLQLPFFSTPPYSSKIDKPGQGNSDHTTE